MSSLIITRVLQRPKDPSIEMTVEHYSVEPRKSKIQDLLGITNEELKTARSYSASPTSTTRLASISLSDATTVPAPGITGAERSGESPTAHMLDIVGNSLSTNKETNQIGVSSKALHTPILRTCASASTLRSHYDNKETSPNSSRQKPNLPSRGLAMTKEKHSTSNNGGQKMEHTRLLPFFKPLKSKASKPNFRDSPIPERRNNSPELLTEALPNARIKTWSRWQSDMPVSSHPKHIMNHDSHIAANKSLSSASPQKQATSIPLPIAASSYTPFVKVNVRRPKAGIEHWFDALQDELSDVEDDEGSKLRIPPSTLVQNVHADNKEAKVAQTTLIHYSDTVSKVPRTTEHLLQPMPVTTKVQKNGLTSGKAVVAHNETTVHEPKTKDAIDPFHSADLSYQSVLNLSSSEDSEDSEDEFHQAEFPATGENLADDTTDDTPKQAKLSIDPIAAQKSNRSQFDCYVVPPDNGPLKRPAQLASPLPIRSRASSQRISYITEMSESEMITSFPATPSENSSRRTSIRTSVAFSDAASMRSTRLIHVTKQEERLLAAIRLKKAAMQGAEKDTERKSALKVLESGGKWSIDSASRLHRLAGDQVNSNARLSNIYAPSRGRTLHRSTSGDRMAYPRESGTTFQTTTDTISSRSSQGTFRSDFSEDLQLPYTAYSRDGHAGILPPSLSSRNDSRPRIVAIRDTFLSTNSNSPDRRRDSHIVMLDGLDENSDRQAIPSQLFMESPFIGWERMGLTSAR